MSDVVLPHLHVLVYVRAGGEALVSLLTGDGGDQLMSALGKRSLLEAMYFTQVQTVALTVFAFAGGVAMWRYRRYKARI